MVFEKLLCPSRSLWRWAWQDRVSQNNTRPARPRPQSTQCTRPRPRPDFGLRLVLCGPKTNGLRPHYCFWVSSYGTFAIYIVL